MAERRLFLDCDGVLADFDAGARRLFGEPFDRFQAKHGSREVWRRIARADNFYGSLPEMPDARLLFDAVRHLDPTILTGLPLARQIDLIIQEADAMDSMVQALIKGGKPAQIVEKAALLDGLENKGDAVLSELLVNLMKDTKDVRRMILRKDIYDLLERVIDGYRDAAGIALQIALKNS